MLVTPDTDFSNISWNWLCYQHANFQKYFWKLTLFADAILLQIWYYRTIPGYQTSAMTCPFLDFIITELQVWHSISSWWAMWASDTMKDVMVKSHFTMVFPTTKRKNLAIKLLFLYSTYIHRGEEADQFG